MSFVGMEIYTVWQTKSTKINFLTLLSSLAYVKSEISRTESGDYSYTVL